MTPDHHTLQKLLTVDYQSVIFVYPTYPKAQKAYLEATSHPLTPEPHYFTDLLSIVGPRVPNERREVIIRFMSQNTAPENIRGMKAIIRFPEDLPKSRYYLLWKEAARLHERFHV